MTIASVIAGAHRAARNAPAGQAEFWRDAIDPLTGPRGACLVLDQGTPIGDQLAADWPTIGDALTEAETRARAEAAAVVTAEVASEPLPPVDAVAELDPPTQQIDMAALLGEDPLPAVSPALAHWLATGEIPTVAMPAEVATSAAALTTAIDQAAVRRINAGGDR